MESFKTVLHEGAKETMIKKSRFIGHIKPVQSQMQAQAFIDEIKKKHYNATHNVPVYVIGTDYELQKFSDDGEPGGTAGLPILEMLKKQGITDVCIVVTRYFGGIKLGTGGLVRAYTEGAKIALESGELVQKIKYEEIMIKTDYTFHGKIQNELLNDERVIVEETLFTDLVTIKLFVLEEHVSSIRERLTEITSDQMQYIEGISTWLTFKEEQRI